MRRENVPPLTPGNARGMTLASQTADLVSSGGDCDFTATRCVLATSRLGGRPTGGLYNCVRLGHTDWTIDGDSDGYRGHLHSYGLGPGLSCIAAANVRFPPGCHHHRDVDFIEYSRRDR